MAKTNIEKQLKKACKLLSSTKCLLAMIGMTEGSGSIFYSKIDKTIKDIVKFQENCEQN